MAITKTKKDIIEKIDKIKLKKYQTCYWLDMEWDEYIDEYCSCIQCLGYDENESMNIWEINKKIDQIFEITDNKIENLIKD